MIISNNNNHKDYNRKNNFGNGAFTATMNYLATNEAIGATVVDMGAMVIPRTVIDSTRSPEAGAETLRRELVSCLFFAGMGLFGLGAAHAIQPFNVAKKYEVPLPKITAGSDAIDSLAHPWAKALSEHTTDRVLTNENKGKVIHSYLNEVIGSISGIDGETTHALKDNSDMHKEIVGKLKEVLLNKDAGFALEKEVNHDLVKKVIHSAGSSDVKLSIPGKEALSISAEDLLSNTYTMARTFMSDKVAETFKNKQKVEDNAFIKDLKGFGKNKMVLGLAAASAFAISMQAINRWVTKKKTGSDGFVAQKGQKAEKDNSMSFKAMKVAASAAMAAYAGSQIIKGEGYKDAFKKIGKKLEFTKLMPNMAQYKFIYGVTIMGRFLASTDKNELRESVTRDFLGFTSWLVLGDIAARGIARGLEKFKGVTLLNHKAGHQSGLWDLLQNSSLKTHEDILYGRGQNTLGKKVGDAVGHATEVAQKASNCRTIAQIGGYVASGLLLGIGIPLLNKTITNKVLAGKKTVQLQPQTQSEAKSEPNKKLVAKS